MSHVIDRPESTVRSSRKYWKLWIVLFLLVVPALLFAGYTWVTLNFAYASGERAGYVQKMSKKGWLCKTWEGELAMTTFPGTAPQIFEFSVRDEATALRIQQVAGQRWHWPTSSTRVFQLRALAKPSTSLPESVRSAR